jgi:calcineurin-like phosphoesterase family protein
MSRDIWFISDTHFGHENIIKHCRPNFKDVGDMDKMLIDFWNHVVKCDDLVYHLGDFAWTAKHAKFIRPMLNGTIRLIVGNHDDIPALAASGMFQKIELWRNFKQHGFTATHIPLRQDQLRHGFGNIHGHVHGNVATLESFHFDASVETLGYGPIHFDEVAYWASKINARYGVENAKN